MPGFRLSSAMVAVALLAAAAPTQAALPLVQNGSFEAVTGSSISTETTIATPTGWSFGACTAFCDYDKSYLFSFTLQNDYFQPSSLQFYNAEDKAYIKLASSPGRSPDGGNALTADPTREVGLIYQSITGLTVGSTYQLSFYQASAQEYGYSGGFTGDWQVSFGDDVRTSAPMVTPSRGSTAWTQQVMTFTAKYATETLGFLAQANEGAQPPFVLLDGVSLVQVPEPSSITLFAFGLLATVGLARRHRRATKMNGRRVG